MRPPSASAFAIRLGQGLRPQSIRWGADAASKRDPPPPGSAGVPPAHVLAQPRPSPPPGSTGNGAGTLLRPSPWRSRRQGGRERHRGETERHETGVHAGGTPALPGGPPPIALAPQGDRDGRPFADGRLQCESNQCREREDWTILPEDRRLERPAEAVEEAFIPVRALGAPLGGRG